MGKSLAAQDAEKARIVNWSDDYALQINEIDSQHKVLFDLLNDLWVAVRDKKDVSELHKILAGLEKCTLEHFAQEQSMMERSNYPDYKKHLAAHHGFVAKIAEEKAKLAAGQPITDELMRFLMDWLSSHIMTMDRAYADYFESKGVKVGGFFSRLFSFFKW